MSYGFVYMTTNLVNNKKYIGKHSKNSENYFGSGRLLIKAIKKYGRHNFNREILSYANSKIELDDLEIYYIQKYDAIKSKNFYNLNGGGTGGNCFIGYSDEELKEYKEKMRKINKEIQSRLEVKEKIGKANSGRKFTDEHKNKLSEATRIKKPSRNKKVYSVFNGKINNFDSIKDCSVFFKINIHTARKILFSKKPYEPKSTNKLLVHLRGLEIKDGEK